MLTIALIILASYVLQVVAISINKIIFSYWMISDLDY